MPLCVPEQRQCSQAPRAGARCGRRVEVPEDDPACAVSGAFTCTANSLGPFRSWIAWPVRRDLLECAVHGCEREALRSG